MRFISKFDEIVNDYDYYIFDCDGVIWDENKIIQSCVDMIKSLLQQKKQLFFLSNTNQKSKLDVKIKLYKYCGLDIPAQNVYTASYLISMFIRESYPTLKNIYLVGSSGLEYELEDKGFVIFGGPNNKNIDYIENYHSSNISQFEVNNEIEACVAGYDEDFNLFKLTYAGEVINKTGLFFGTNYDKKRRIGNKFTPSSYCFISAIETFTGKKAEIITKPNPRSLDVIMSDHNIESFKKDRILMIGDYIQTDIKFANNNKIHSLLVLTGITKRDDLNNMSSDNLPTYILEDV